MAVFKLISVGRATDSVFIEVPLAAADETLSSAVGLAVPIPILLSRVSATKRFSVAVES